MKFNKKICSLLMALILMLSVVPAFAEDTAETVNTPSERYYKDVEILTSLGIYSFGDRAFDSTVTRGEFAKMVADLIGADTAGADCNCFSDVTAETKNRGAIHAVSSMGLMNGMGDSTFRPDDSITYMQAIKVLVSALGYKPLADAEGGYYNGYLKCAQNIGLYVNKATDYNSALTFENAAELIIKTAETEIFDIVSVSDKSSVFEAVEGNTVLSVYHNIYFGEGRMTDNGITALNGTTALSTESVKIGNNVFAKADEKAKDYLGYNLEYYYRDNGGVYTLLYAGVDERKNDNVTINADELLTDDNSFSKTCIVAEGGSKKKEYKIYRYATLIYNGVYDATFTSASLKINQGSITLIDCDNNSEYETVIVNEYTDLVVSSCQAENEKLIAKKSVDTDYMTINYGEYKFAIFENEKGEKIDPSTVKADNVISAFLSKDKSKAKFIVSAITDEITVGTIDNEEETIAYDGEKAYVISPDYERESLSGSLQYPGITLGETYKIYLNFEGKIAAAEKTDGRMQYAYYMGLSKGTGLSSNDIYVKLFLESNDCVYAKASKKIEVNCVKKQSPSMLYDENTKLVDAEGNMKPQLVRIILNSKGELTMIETAQNDEAYLNKNYSAATTAPTIYSIDLDRFTLNYQDMQTTNASAPASTAANVKIVAGGFAVDRETKYFIIRNTSDSFTTTDEQELEVVDYDTFGKLYGKAHMKLYDADATWICGAALLSLPTSLNNRFFTVAESPRMVMRDGMTIMQLSGYFKNNYWNFYESEENIFSNAVKDAGYSDGSVKKGDVFQIAFDTDTISIISARLVYSPLRHNKGSFYTPVWSASINGSNDEFWMLGTVMSYNNGTFGIYSENKLGQAADNYWMKPLNAESSYTYSPIFLPNYLITAPTVLQFDCATKELTRVTPDDIPVGATINATGDGFDIIDINTMVFVGRARAVVSDVLIITNLDAVN